MSDISEDIEILEKFCKNPIGVNYSETKQAIENLLTRYKQLEEENKNMAEEYLVNNPGMAKYLNDNYIFKSKVEENIQDLESRGYFEEANAMKDLLERSREDEIKRYI